MGNRDYQGNTEAQLSQALRKIDKRWICKRSFIVQAGIADIVFIDTTPFVYTYFNNSKEQRFDWSGIMPRDDYLSSEDSSWTPHNYEHWANKVDLYINGHDHCLEHLSNQNGSMQFLTSGGGSKAWKNKIHYENHSETTHFYYDGQGFISVELLREKANITFFDVMGKPFFQNLSPHKSSIKSSGMVHIFMVDTNPFVNKYFTKAKKFNWEGVLPRSLYIYNLLRDLNANLRASNATWKIVVGHHPIRSIGKRGDTQELVKLLLPILQANKVPIYINGHEHCLEHINNTGSPIEFLTSGGGSRAWGNITHHEKHKNNFNFYYSGQDFISVQVTRREAKMSFHDVFAKILHSFMLTKYGGNNRISISAPMY
ncbi:purple acid phosphatase, partial [Striga asiatica]